MSRDIFNRDDLVAAVIRILNGLHQKLVCLITPETTTGYNSERTSNKILTNVSRHLLTHWKFVLLCAVDVTFWWHQPFFVALLLATRCTYLDYQKTQLEFKAWIKFHKVSTMDIKNKIIPLLKVGKVLAVDRLSLVMVGIIIVLLELTRKRRNRWLFECLI